MGQFKKIKVGDLVLVGQDLLYRAVTETVRDGPKAGSFNAEFLLAKKNGSHEVHTLHSAGVTRVGFPPKLKAWHDSIRVFENKNGRYEDHGTVGRVLAVLADGAGVEFKVVNEKGSYGGQSYIAMWPNFRKVEKVKPGLGKFKYGEIISAPWHYPDSPPLRVCTMRSDGLMAETPIGEAVLLRKELFSKVSRSSNLDSEFVRAAVDYWKFHRAVDMLSLVNGVN